MEIIAIVMTIFGCLGSSFYALKKSSEEKLAREKELRDLEARFQLALEDVAKSKVNQELWEKQLQENANSFVSQLSAAQLINR